MRFRISRASDNYPDSLEPPVPGAVVEIREVTVTRPRADGLWERFKTERGRNHRKVTKRSTYIDGSPSKFVDYVREEDRHDWFVEVNTLDELMALSAQVDERLIVTNKDDVEDGDVIERPTIIIYDSYIE